MYMYILFVLSKDNQVKLTRPNPSAQNRGIRYRQLEDVNLHYVKDL